MHQPSYIPPLHALLGRSLWLGLVLVDLVKRRNEAFPDFSGAIETRKGIDPVPSVLNCQKKGVPGRSGARHMPAIFDEMLASNI